MPALDPGFSGVTAWAKRLQVAGVIGKLWVRPDWFDVIHFQPPATATGFAAIPVAFEDFGPQHLANVWCW